MQQSPICIGSLCKRYANVMQTLCKHPHALCKPYAKVPFSIKALLLALGRPLGRPRLRKSGPWVPTVAYDAPDRQIQPRVPKVTPLSPSAKSDPQGARSAPRGAQSNPRDLPSLKTSPQEEAGGMRGAIE